MTIRFTIGGETRRDPGVLSNKVNRRARIDDLATAIREKAFDNMWLEFWKECASTHKNPRTGRDEAQSGAFDDQVIAAAIALEGDENLPPTTRPAKRLARTPGDYDHVMVDTSGSDFNWMYA